MENSTKALLIAASVLVVIVIIGLGVRIVSSTSNTIKQSTEVSETLNSSLSGAVDKFNQKLSGGKTSATVDEDNNDNTGNGDNAGNSGSSNNGDNSGNAGNDNKPGKTEDDDNSGSDDNHFQDGGSTTTRPGEIIELPVNPIKPISK